MAEQITKSFDSETIRKLIKSFSLNLASAVGAFLVALSQNITIEQAIYIALATFGAFLVNLPIEYNKGTKVVE